jgi:MFS family permease
MVNRSRLLIDLGPIRSSRDFRLVWLSQLASTVGRQVVIVAVPFQAYVLTRSSFAVGLLGLFQAVPIVAAGLYGGALADRLDRRRLQLAAKAVVATGSAVLAVAASLPYTPLALVYAVVVFTSAASTIDQSARMSTIPRLVSRELLPAAVSLGQVLFQAAAIVGPALAGLVIANLGLRWAYAIDVIAFFPAASLIWRLSPQPPLHDQHVVLGWRAPAQAIRYVARNRLVIGLFSSDLVAMVFGMPYAVFPALALTEFRVGAGALGLFYAAPAVGALVGSVLSGWIGRVSRQGMAVFVAIALWGVAIAGFGLADGRLWLGLPLLAVAGAADVVSAVFRNTILQLSIPDSIRGRMSAFHMMVVTTGPRLGDLEAGAVAALVNPTFSVVSGGVACVVGIGVLAGWLPEMRNRRREDGLTANARAAE